MILTTPLCGGTTDFRVQGHYIRRSHLRRRCAEVISGVDVLRDFTAGLSNFFGGRSGAYEEELTNARETALRELEQRAQERGANAVVGVDVDYEVLGSNNGMLMVTASGTAVLIG